MAMEPGKTQVEHETSDDDAGTTAPFGSRGHLEPNDLGPGASDSVAAAFDFSVSGRDDHGPIDLDSGHGDAAGTSGDESMTVALSDCGSDVEVAFGPGPEPNSPSRQSRSRSPRPVLHRLRQFHIPNGDAAAGPYPLLESEVGNDDGVDPEDDAHHNDDNDHSDSDSESDGSGGSDGSSPSYVPLPPPPAAMGSCVSAAPNGFPHPNPGPSTGGVSRSGVVRVQLEVPVHCAGVKMQMEIV